MLRAAAPEPNFDMPAFPMPKLAEDQYGQNKRMGMMSLTRQLYSGGISDHTIDDLSLLDSDYAVIDSRSIPVLAAWLEATCQAVEFKLSDARQKAYDGTVAARLLGIGATLAALRWDSSGLAMPIGILVCVRRQPWGSLPADKGRDAYALIATERGLEVYDPPTRQIVELSRFPNTADILNIVF
jgi:ligand-binding sensor domain-containing protein